MIRNFLAFKTCADFLSDNSMDTEKENMLVFFGLEYK